MTVSINTIESDQNYLFAGQDINWMVEQWLETRGDHPCMVWEPKDGQTKTWSYQDFAKDIQRVAAGLLANNIKLGDKVLIHCDNCPEAVISWYACAKIGAIAVTTNTRCIGEEIAYFIEHSEAVIAITQPQHVKEISTEGQQLRQIWVTDDNSGEPASEDQQHNYPSWNTLLDHGDQIPERKADPMLPVSIQFTSGTTSRPKAVVHTHANALWGGRSCSQNHQMDSTDVYLVFLPFFHVNAQSWCIWSTLWVGGTFVLQPKFSASRFWELSLNYKCTRASMIPFCMKAIGPQPVPEHHYRTWTTGVILPEVEEWFKAKTFAAWGMTETIAHGTRSDLHQPSPRMSIGKPAPGYNIAIVNEETGELCPEGETGRLYIKGTRGIQLFLEYYNNPEANQKAFNEEGWFDTGDTVTLGENGQIFFADRDKDVLKVGGENVSALQIEQACMAVGGLDEVAVVAQEHDMLDEAPVLFAIKNPNVPLSDEELKDKIMEHCQGNLADFKVPHAIYFVEEFPRATLNKIAKNELRELANELKE